MTGKRAYDLAHVDTHAQRAIETLDASGADTVLVPVTWQTAAALVNIIRDYQDTHALNLRMERVIHGLVKRLEKHERDV